MPDALLSVRAPNRGVYRTISPAWRRWLIRSIRWKAPLPRTMLVETTGAPMSLRPVASTPNVGRPNGPAVISSPLLMWSPNGAAFAPELCEDHTSPLIAAMARWPSPLARLAMLVVRSSPTTVSLLIAASNEITLASAATLTKWTTWRPPLVPAAPQSWVTPGATGRLPSAANARRTAPRASWGGEPPTADRRSSRRGRVPTGSAVATIASATKATSALGGFCMTVGNPSMNCLGDRGHGPHPTGLGQAGPLLLARAALAPGRNGQSCTRAATVAEPPLAASRSLMCRRRGPSPRRASGPRSRRSRRARRGAAASRASAWPGPGRRRATVDRRRGEAPSRTGTGRPAACSTAATTSRTEWPMPVPRLRPPIVSPAARIRSARRCASARSTTWM